MRKLHPFICLTFSHKYIYTYTTAQLSALTHTHIRALPCLQGVGRHARQTIHFLERNTIAIITIHAQRYKTQQHARPEGATASPSHMHTRAPPLFRQHHRHNVVYLIALIVIA